MYHRLSLINHLKPGGPMSVEAKLSALLDLAETLDIEVRHVDLGGQGGGSCIIKGKRVLFVDIGADRATRYDRILSDIAQIPEINALYIRPELREDLDRVQAQQ